MSEEKVESSNPNRTVVMLASQSWLIAMWMRPSPQQSSNPLASMACALALIFALASGERHPHSGKATPFVPGDPGIRLGSDALRILRAGLPYRTQIPSGATGGRGVVVQDVEAPPDVVWGRILDFAGTEEGGGGRLSLI